MKAICVADVHGDVGALGKLVKSISGRGFERFFLLGPAHTTHFVTKISI